MRIRKRKDAGFSLVELAVVLIIVGILTGMGITSLYAYMERESRATTFVRLDAVEQALYLYAARNKRLPCPADGSLAETNASAGIEQRSGNVCTSGLQYSTVPWRDLGLAQGASYDGWNRKLTYRVFYDATGTPAGQRGLVRPGGMDMSQCVASAADDGGAITDCASDGSTAPIEFLRNKGLTIRTNVAPAGSVIRSSSTPEYGGGAAFVLVSHGKNGTGGYIKSGANPGRSESPPLSSLSGYVMELENLDFTTDDIYIDSRMSDAQNAVPANFFDDIIRAPSIHWASDKANLGPQ
ncbi:MAG TPA: hypothetical protein DCW68_03720 [Rhodospirillaceae bacterium]|nr:MAG: hypothetical protein A2018_07800 [Alphaproteobacteria bacterium GWF2_58_20]HAU29202.1 hypothetical protein [Rhodospirillaceae bacterium]